MRRVSFSVVAEEQSNKVPKSAVGFSFPQCCFRRLSMSVRDLSSSATTKMCSYYDYHKLANVCKAQQRPKQTSERGNQIGQAESGGNRYRFGFQKSHCQITLANLAMAKFVCLLSASLLVDSLSLVALLAGHLFIFHPQRWSLAALLLLSLLTFSFFRHAAAVVADAVACVLRPKAE